MLKPAPTRAARERPTSAAPFLALFLGALALRLAYVVVAAGVAAQPYSDALEYDQVAWNLARGAGFRLGEGLAAYPTAFVPPLLPWLVSLVYRVAGHQYFAALVLQCVAGALVPLLAYSLGAAMFGGRVGWRAGVIAAVNPLLVFFSGYLLTETVFSVTLLAALIASVEWVKTPRPGRATGAGLLWGVAALARPPALLLPLVVAAWGWRPLGLALRAGDRRRQVALLLAGAALVIAPWTLRNAVMMHAFVPVTTGVGRALLDSNNPTVWNDHTRRGGAVAALETEPYASEFRGLSEVHTDALARRRAWEFLDAHRGEWVAMAGAKLARFWRVSAEGGGTGNWQRDGSPLAALRARVDPLFIWSLLVMPLAAWGMVRSAWGLRRWFQVLPLLVIAYFTLGAMVFWGALRMRLPIEPLVALLAAVGFEDLRRRWRGRRLSVLEGRLAS
ncbi:MAG: ArnT family glycosyltransferase [Candidatus Eiseniibacteriota bacterium]